MPLFEDKYRFIVKCIAEDGFWMQWRPRLIIRFAELGMDGIAYKDETQEFQGFDEINTSGACDNI